MGWVFCLLLPACGLFSKSAPPPAAAPPAAPAMPDFSALTVPQPQVPTPAVPPPSDYEAKAIEIRYRADRQLNSYEDQAHTLVLVIYQLANPNPYHQLLKDEEGLKKLLEGKAFDPVVVDVYRVIVQPGENNALLLDRAENARWIGLVAGYYELASPRASRLFKIPLLAPAPGADPLPNPRPGPLVLNLLLGPQAIRQFGEKL